VNAANDVGGDLGGGAAKIAKIAKQSDFAASSAADGSSTTPVVARKLSLRVSGARAGDTVRPANSGPPAAGTIVRASDPYALPAAGSSRRGLRVHARGTMPPPFADANGAPHCAGSTTPGAGIEESLLGDLGDLGGSPSESKCAESAYAESACFESERSAIERSVNVAKADDEPYPWEGQP